MPDTESFQFRPERKGLVRTSLVLAILAGFLLAACSQTDNSPCPPGSDPFVKYELFMGRSTPDGGTVSDQQWESFLSDTVTPRFPDGLTVLDARGQWRNSEGQILKEGAKLLVILAPPGEELRRLIDEVSEEYKDRFNQESVLEVESNTCVSFS